jgi:23S rRNA (guanine745-N1)-methyltransferase
VNSSQPCAGYLACPVCDGSLADADGGARCATGHSFDYARSGYLNLTGTGGGRTRVGDTAAMVRARAEFLDAGHYEPIARAIAEAAIAAVADVTTATVAVSPPVGTAAASPAPTLLVEIGSGTGYHLDAAAAALRERSPRPTCAVGFDLSKAAAGHAARRHPELSFVVVDVETRVPLRDAAADLVLSVFSPRPAAELGRVVRPGGELVAAFAGPRHLERLRERLGLIGVGENKLGRLTERLRSRFYPVSTTAVEYEVALTAADTRHLVLMGPNAWHNVDPETLDSAVADLVSVTVARFRARGAPPG